MVRSPDQLELLLILFLLRVQEDTKEQPQTEGGVIFMDKSTAVLKADCLIQIGAPLTTVTSLPLCPSLMNTCLAMSLCVQRTLSSYLPDKLTV